MNTRPNLVSIGRIPRLPTAPSRIDLDSNKHLTVRVAAARSCPDVRLDGKSPRCARGECHLGYLAWLEILLDVVAMKVNGQRCIRRPLQFHHIVLLDAYESHPLWYSAFIDVQHERDLGGLGCAGED